MRPPEPGPGAAHYLGAVGTFAASLLLASTTGLRAAPPVLEHLFPPSARPGSTQELRVVGTFNPWPVDLVFSHPGIHAVPSTNSPVFTLTLDPAVPTGVHLVRAMNAEGASNPRFLIVGTNQPTTEVEPNDAGTQAQKIQQLPATVEGRLEKRDDVDQFEVTLAKGRTLVARLDAFLLGSPIDAVLRIRDGHGSLIGWNHDDGFTFDPLLAITAPADGAYRIEVFGFAHPAESDIRFTGNARCIYRLHLHDGPYARSLSPAGLSTTHPTLHTPVGYNLPQPTPSLTNPPTQPSLADGGWAEPTLPGILGPARVPVADGPVWLEPEPHTNAVPVPVPVSVTGTLATRGELDRYAFTTTNGTTYRVQVHAAAIGSPLDAFVRILDESGKQLAHNDDSVLGDPVLTWKAPTNGSFVVVVGSVLSSAGPAHAYHLVLHPVPPGIRAVAAAASISLEPGRTNELKVSLERLGGYTGPVQIEVPGLPAGVSAPSIEVGADAREATLSFITASNAAPAQRAFRVLARPGTNAPATPAVHEMATTGENNGVPQGFHRLLLNDTDWLWLTVRKSQP